MCGHVRTSSLLAGVRLVSIAFALVNDYDELGARVAYRCDFIIRLHPDMRM